MTPPYMDALDQEIETDELLYSQPQRHGSSQLEQLELVGDLPKLSSASAFKLGRLQSWRDCCSSAPLILLDAGSTATALCLAFAAESLLSPQPRDVPLGFGLAVVGMTLLFQHIHGLYPACGLPYSLEFRRVLRTCLMVCVSLSVGLILSGPASHLAWSSYMLFCGSLVLLLSASRPLARKVLGRFDWWAQPVAVVGNSSRALKLHQRLNRCRHEGLRSVGVVFDPQRHWQDPQRGEQPHYIGPISDLESILLSSGACRLAVADRDSAQWQDFHSFHGIPHVMLPTDLEHHPTEKTRLVESDGRIELHCHSALTNPSSLLAKRLMDLCLVGLSAPLWFPLMVLIAIGIKFSDAGPIFYRQTRVGRFRRPFQALKFRSMVCDADRRLREYLSVHPELHAEWQATHKLKHDPRVTSIGRFLRKSSLDELPQLWNVLVGEMSLVGPRPIVDCGDYDREYIDEHPEVFELYQMVRPGVTGLWQISGRNSLPYKQRVYLDRFYLRNWSIMFDIFILWRTFKTALFREGAY